MPTFYVAMVVKDYGIVDLLLLLCYSCKMSSPGLEVFARSITPEDPTFAECLPKGVFNRLEDIPADFLAELGAEHIVVDFDGTLIPRGRRTLEISPDTLEWLELITQDTRFKSLSMATDGGGFDTIEDLTRWGVKLDAIYQPWVIGTDRLITKQNASFWRKILFDKDCLDTPGKVLNIGDSPIHDIVPAQQEGLQAVLVDRLEYRFPGFPAKPSFE